MTKKEFVLAGLIVFPQLLLAQQQQRMFYKIVDRDGTSHEVDPRTWVDPAVSNLNYDNYLPTFFGGTVVLTGSSFVGFDEIGDDLNLVGQIGYLDSIGFNVSNRSLTSGFGVGRFTIRVRDRSTQLITGQTSFQFDLDMPANTGAFFELPPGIFSNANIALSPNVWMTMQWDFIQGATQSTDIKTFYGAPQVLGSSSSMIRNFTSGVDTDLGGSPANSFMWYVRTTPVPAPGAAGLLFVLGLGAARRKR